jgi:hypothetical protein
MGEVSVYLCCAGAVGCMAFGLWPVAIIGLVGCIAALNQRGGG